MYSNKTTRYGSTLLSTSVLFAALFSTAPAFAADPVVWVSWGGSYGTAEKKSYLEPWMKMTGNDAVMEDYNGGVAQIRAQVESGNVSWDIVAMIPGDMYRACDEGLLEVLDHSELAPAPDGTPATEDFIPGALTDCGVANNVWSTVWSYSKSSFPGNPPRTVADFWDVERFPGKRGLRKTPEVNLEWALMADGVPRDKVYQVLSTSEGVDRAFRSLGRIKAHIVWWEAGAQPPQLLADGEVVMTSAYNGRIYNAVKNEDQDFAIAWDTQVWDLGHWVILKGAPHRDKAWELLRFATTPKQLPALTEYLAYGPPRKSSAVFVSDKVAHDLPSDPQNMKNALAFDVKFWADHADELGERFSTWLAHQ
jgi:putative spermidine/putrescine transport system substrate-binding protein